MGSVIDLISGNIYFFNKDIGTSGGTIVSGTTYPQVNLFSNLPLASLNSGKIYVVRTQSGNFLVNIKPSGFYFSDGNSWKFLGDTIDFFKSNNFQIYDSDDNTKGISFTTSGLTTNIFRKLNIQNSDGTIAYLDDVDLKVDTVLFNIFTGNTNNNINNISGITDTKLATITFNNFTGSTLPTNYYNKVEIDNYTGSTHKRTSVTALTYVPLISDRIIGILGTTGGTVHINLPNISVVGNKTYWIFKDEGFNAGNNHIIFSAFTGNYIEKVSNITLTVNGGSITIYNDGVLNWYII